MTPLRFTLIIQAALILTLLVVVGFIAITDPLLHSKISEASTLTKASTFLSTIFISTTITAIKDKHIKGIIVHCALSFLCITWVINGVYVTLY